MSFKTKLNLSWKSLVIGVLLTVGYTVTPQVAQAEYADVVINNYADAAGMRPAVFPHWFHRIRFRCKVCHADLGFKFKAGGNKITMAKIIEGRFCGACHNGEIAWSVENCAMCHSGIPGTPTHFHGSTLQRLVAPAYKPLGKPKAAAKPTNNKAKK
ncbi:MAG: c(7)-type cytochrome triheme domain-containing protein [Gammaproteobacteria bacterium]